jgi:hypothetical protein
MKLRCSSEFSPEPASTRIGWMLPSCPLLTDYRVFARSGSRDGSRAIAGPSLELPALLQSPPGVERPLTCLRSLACRAVGSFPGVLFPSSVSPLGAAAFRSGLPHPTTCAFGFSRPLDAFIRPEPAGLVSCQIRSWGFTLQSFAPPAQPFAVSGASALMSLETPFSPTRPPDIRTQACFPRARVRRSERPSPPGLCSTRESATPLRLFRPARARSSPGLGALQGSPPLQP